MAETLKVGDTFTSYQSVHQAVVRYGNAHRVQYWKRDTKRLHRATPKVYEIAKEHPQLEYCTVRFTCIHGGQPFRPKPGFSERKRRGTWKQNCKAEILVGLNEDRNRLVVKKIVDEHNHEIPSEEVFKQLPKNKRNTVTGSKFQLPAARSQETRSILENIVKVNSLARSNNLRKLANVLLEKYDCLVDLQSDDEDRIVGFFFQDRHMLRYFEAFPEIVLIDGSCRLQNISCCVYVVSTENSVGDCEVVAVCVLTVEDRDSTNWMLERFKERNPKWENIGIVMTDRLTSQYQIIEDQFPNARRLICLSHALQTFKKDTLPSKVLIVTASEAEKSCDFFNKLIEASNEEEYRTILEEMEDSVAYPLVQYFFNNWQNLRHEWVKGFTSTVKSCVNSKFDSPNAKLKYTIANCKTFGRFVENLFLVLNMRRNAFKCNYSRLMTKNQPYTGSPLKEYSQHLTPYATEKIKRALQQLDTETDADRVRFEEEDSDVVCRCRGGGAFVVSEISCTCDDFTLLKLPCVHLLAYRRSKGLDLFDPYLFSQRWTKAYLLKLCSDVGGPGATGRPTDASLGEKLEQAQSLCLSLAGLCSEVGGERLEARIEVLEKLRELWGGGEEAAVEKVEQNSRNDHDYLMAVGSWFK